MGEENSYAGRWVARLLGRIVAQGGTPDQARHAARSRFKETPEIIFMPTITPLIFPPLLDSVRANLPEGVTVYLVGGAVRDALLGRQTHDLDFTLERDAIKLARRIANALKADFYPLDPERDTGRVIVSNDDGTRTFMDFAAFRGEELTTGVQRGVDILNPAAQPTISPAPAAPAQAGKNLESDIAGRDFTLNAIAFNLNDNTIYDPLGGAMDLKEKSLRACSPSALKDDPVRILRGIRLAANFGFHILPDTRAMMKEAAGFLDNISAERLRDELFRILEGQQLAASLRALDRLGALEKVLPELSSLKGVEQIPPHVHDVWEHTLAVVNYLESILSALRPNYNPDKASDLFNGLLVLRIGRYRQQLGELLSTPLIADRTLRGLLFMAALFHDVAKPKAKKADEGGQLRFWGHDEQGAEMAAERARHLALSNDEIQRLETIIRNHMRIHFHTNRLVREGKLPTRRAIYRYYRDSGPAGVDICLLTLADLRATYEKTLPQEAWTACLDVTRAMLEAWFEKKEEQVAPPLLVNGNDLMGELSLKSGPVIGKLIEAIREAQAVGEVATREQALKLAREKLAALQM